MIFRLKQISDIKKVNKCLIFHYYFSNSSKITKLSQKAIIASKLIEQIAKPRNFQQIKNGSLTKKLIKTINDNELASQQAKNQLLSLFTTGIPINTQIFDQDRHKDQIYRRLKFKDGEPKMIFSPTSIVTGQIFQKLINPQQLQTYNLFMGHYGISKTKSLQLYWHLSNIISEYRVESINCQNKISQEVKNYPKLIYLNINPGDSLETIRNKIFIQCKQLGDKIKIQQFLNSQYPIKAIKSIFKIYEIQTILGVDQLNEYANLLRNNLQNQIYKIEVIKPLMQKLKQQSLTRQQQQIYQQYFDPSEYEQRKEIAKKVAEFRLIFSYLGRNFNQYAYFSSVNLQQKIIQTLNLAFSKHNKLYHKRISYLELLPLSKTIYQLVDFFLFEIQEGFLLSFNEKKNFLSCIKEGIVRQIIFRHLAKKSQQYILTPYIISNYLIDKKQKVQDVLRQTILNFQKNKINYQQSLTFQQKVKILQPLLQKLQKIIDQMIDIACLDLTPNFSKFLHGLTKGNQFKIVNEILFGYYKNKQTNNVLQKFYMLQSFEINLNVVENGVQIFKLCVDKWIFYEDNYGKMYIFIPKKLLLKIVQPLKNASILYMLNNYTHNSIEGLYKRNQLGKYFQKVFISALLIQNVQIQFQSIKTKFTPFDSTPLGFIPVPQKKQQMETFNFLQSFSRYAQYLNNKSEKKFTLFLPLNPQYQNKQFIQKVISGDQKISITNSYLKSKCINFIIIRNPQIQENLRINCFDLTISTSVLTKITNFLESYENFSKSTLSQIDWQGQLKQVMFNFYVISGEKSNKKLKQQLDDKFKGRFRFIQSTNKNNLQVKHITQSGQKTVGIVGSLYLGRQDLKITDSTIPNEGIKNISYFDKLMKIIEKQQKRNKK